MGEAANSAAYLEIGGQIPVAVVADDDLFLQGLRFDVLPEGPELDGLVGANALGRSRLELDYPSSPSRAVFSCETDAREACWAAARCPQLPDRSSRHYCFGLRRTGCRPAATRTPVFRRPMAPPTRRRRTPGRPSRKCDRLQPIRWPAD